MKKLILIYSAVFIIISVSGLNAQRLINRPMFTGTTIGSNKVNRIYIPPPAEFKNRREGKGGASIDFYYTGFSETAKSAIEYAGSVLESILPADVHITVKATWMRITTSGVLANSTATGYAVGWGIDAFMPWAIYPAALAEKIAGEPLNGDLEGDIELNVNSSVNWYYGTDGNTPSLRYDLVTIVLHELIHGLGFYDSFFADAATGSYGAGTLPLVYDTFVENTEGSRLTDATVFANPSSALKTQITSRGLYFNGPVVSSYLAGGRARLYAPSTYSAGSSVAHLDDDTYQNNNSLMTPFIDLGEAVHDPGMIARSMLGDLGWVNTRIVHEPIRDTEEHISALAVNAGIRSDTSYNHNKVILTWSFDDFSTSSTVFMTRQGTSNNYTATIPVPGYETRLDYFISAEDYFLRLFRMPSDTSNPNSVYIGTDTIRPVILHSAADYYFSVIDTIKLEAQAADNIGIDTVYAEYKINEGPIQYLGMVHHGDKYDYTASLDARLLSVKGGDSIQYRIIAIDQAASRNQRILPASGFFAVKFEQINAPQDSYSTDFSNSAGDFLTKGFSVIRPAGFSKSGLHTKHPYESPEETGDSIGYIAMLRTPVRFDDSGMIISYDEVLLVEPGEEGSTYWSTYFYDYVIVEGSRDFGKTWFALADGYDSRYMDAWETAYNSSITDNNSTYTGNESLLVRHTLFPKASSHISDGDTLIFRFRLFSDPYANGWGWCIQDLHIGPLIDNVQDIKLPETLIYPNPGNGMIFLKQDDGYSLKPLKYSIFASTGTLLLEDYTDGSTESAIDISGFPPGIYFIVLYHNTGIQTLRYILIR